MSSVPRAEPGPYFHGRSRWVLVALAGAMCALWCRAAYLQVFDSGRLEQVGEKVAVKKVKIPVSRGQIRDRNHVPLAVSAPVKTIGVVPQSFAPEPAQLAAMAQVLQVPREKLQELQDPDTPRKFVYVKRDLDPAVAQRVMDLDINGVEVRDEYRRFYPDAEVTGQLVGFTNRDDHGQAGLEWAYDQILQGKPGSKLVLRDGRRRTIADVEMISAPQSGADLILSIDERLQYIAHRELKAGMVRHRAKTGALVMLDVRTGDVLAMANYPSYNPNNFDQRQEHLYRNRALVDTFEPGSTMKPFIVACALDTGLFRPEQIIETAPGYWSVGSRAVRDVHNYGTLNLTGVLQKSSNVGAAKIAMRLPSDVLWRFYTNLGFGQLPGTGFPGEEGGRLAHFRHWRDIEKATMAFGYGISMSAFQLARGYAAIANDGKLPPARIVLNDAFGEPGAAVPIMRASTALAVRRMLETVVSKEGTALKASIPGYRVAGKTGTVRKLHGKVYTTDSYLSLFVGFAPASNPRLVMAVVVDGASHGHYYGGEVAAPIFAKAMGESLKIMGIPPDQTDVLPRLWVAEQHQPLGGL